MPKVAWALSCVAFPLRVLDGDVSVGDIVDFGTEVVAVVWLLVDASLLAGVGLDARRLALVGFALQLELVYLLVNLSNWVRYPFSPRSWISCNVVVAPSGVGFGGYLAGPVVMIPDVVGDNASVTVVPDRPPMNAFSWNARDGCSAADAFCRSESSAIVGFPLANMDGGAFVLH